MRGPAGRAEEKLEGVVRLTGRRSEDLPSQLGGVGCDRDSRAEKRGGRMSGPAGRTEESGAVLQPSC